MNTYQDFIAYLNTRTVFGIKLGLDNIEHILKQLDSPHKKLHFIHVAGTNGKGSVCAMLSSVLNASGIKVGLYTSPHLVDLKERIRINERDITEEEILQVANKIIPLALPETTYFEILTAIAIEFFCQQGVRIAIMETGMGGRLDATNVCDSDIAIITDISMEHTQYLGDTLEKIKDEKMAIIKSKSITITAESLDNDFNIYSRNLSFQEVRIGHYDKLKLNLLGDHQIRNCALALKAIDVLIKKGYNTSFKSIYSGLSKVKWPARFQVLTQNPLVVLDGAHNPGAALVLRKAIEDYIGKDVTLVIGILKDKEYKKTLDILSSVAERVITVTPKSDRALSGLELKALVKNKPCEYAPSIIDALDSVRKNGPVVIAGSLYLAGEVLEYWNRMHADEHG